MLLRSRRRRSFALLAGVLLWMPVEVAHAQQAPVAAMFSDDQKRDASLASSFLMVEFAGDDRCGVSSACLP